MKAALKTVVLASILAATGLLIGAAPAAAKAPCWKTLINDWYDGRIDGTYPATCYRQAIKNAPLDVQAYSSLREDLDRALAVAIHTGKKNVPPGGQGRSGGSKYGTGTTGTQPAGPTRRRHNNGPESAPPKDASGPIADLINKAGPKNADSVPLPLIIIAALALLLLAAGAAGTVARRVQARRVPVEPTPPPTR